MGIFLDAKNPYPDGADRYVARIHTDAGAPRRKEFRTLTEAELFVVRHGGARNFHLRASMSLGTALAWFLECLPADLDPQTIEKYGKDLVRTLLGAIPAVTIMSGITDAHYRDVLADCYAKGLGSYTCFQHFTLIRMFAIQSVVAGFTSVEPVTDILAGIDGTRTRTLVNVPTKPHIRLIRSACGPRTRLVVSLMTKEGMEPIELDRALRKDICFATDTVFIRHNRGGHGTQAHSPGRREALSAQTRTDALRWLATSPGGPDDPLFTHNDPNDFNRWLTVAQRQVGLVRPRGKGTSLAPLYLPKHLPYYAAQARAQTGEDLLSLTERFGYADIASMHRRVGFIVENIAHAKHDRDIIRKAARS